MTAHPDADLGRGGARRRPGSVGVLADRMAAALVHHEPGWRLPRLTALARRYNVSAAEADAALGELAARHLVRRLPDGQVYRASPSVYHVPLEGVFGLASVVDPMGGQLACKTKCASVRQLPDEIRSTLCLADGEQAVAVRCLWTVGGEPGALSMTYLPERLAGALLDGHEPDPAGLVPVGGDDRGSLAGRLPCPAVEVPAAAQTSSGPFPWLPPAEGPRRPLALQVEMDLPPPAAARSLRIAASKLVAMVTVTVGDALTGEPAAVTVAMLRPELFRIVFELTAPSVPAGSLGGLAATWTHAMADWET
jgi:hypothetical protein